MISTNANPLFLSTTALLILTSLALLPHPHLASDTISSTQSISTNQTLVSENGEFELGFFKPSDLDKWYVGIWYRNIPDRVVVWVANRDHPVNGPDGVLQIDGSKIVIKDGLKNQVWSSDELNEVVMINPVAKILDTGNFVLKEEDNDVYVWQSFDYPTDTLLPEMKLGWDSKTGFDRYIRSWKSPDDPSSGDYVFKLNHLGFPEIFLWKGNVKIYRSGPWIGPRFSGVPEMKPSDILSFEFVTNLDEVYYKFVLLDKSILSRLVVNSTGYLQRFTWVESGQVWNPYWYAPKDQCDEFHECGTWGICDTNASPVCKCLPGFSPKNPQAWALRDGSDGCVRTSVLECNSDGFLALKNMKLPESQTALVYPDMSLSECEEACQRNCSCNGYANRLIIGSGSGCVMWSGGLEDMREYGDGTGGQTLYIRMAAADLVAAAGVGSGNGSGKTKEIIKAVSIALGIGVVLLVLGVYIVWKTRVLARTLRKQQSSQDRSRDILRFSDEGVTSNKEYLDEGHDDLDLPLFDFNVIKSCTNEFSDANKLGQGGFGIVYKGTLPDGQVVAMKRLAKNSGQGTDEFKNEVKLIARLQHRNLVRLVGCCVEFDEKVLIYEYLRNRSLDSILFSRERSAELDWPMRFSIICGIARGLLYLHQDSRFRIIHRDLKASNILLDGDLNPKISDFGMARIFERDQTEDSTRRVVGTYGYMAPEYAMDGLFSVKSDVFSFGVLVLEIVSGKKNRGFYYENHELNLLGHAWNFWKDGKGLEIMDPSSGNKYSESEVMRCIQVGLLCVQEHAEDRPNMASVVLMLSSETATMPNPTPPGFCLRRNPLESDSFSGNPDKICSSVNHMTVTMINGR